MVTAHGPYPLYRDPTAIITRVIHYGVVYPISAPLITIAAKLVYFSRRETIPFAIPPHLPRNRAHALQLGRRDVVPTQADVIEFNAHKDTKLPPRTKWDWWADLTDDELAVEDSGISRPDLKATSAKWDNDWMRLRFCSDPWVHTPLKGPVYTAGMLTGLWQGRMLVSLSIFMVDRSVTSC